MAGGFRISESGDSRVSELGDSRITEELIFASASLSTSRGAYRVDELLNERTDELGNSRVSEDFDSVVVSFTGSLVLQGATSLSGGGGVLSAGEAFQEGRADLVATGTISSSSTASFVDSSSVTGEGSVVADPDVTRNAAIALTSISSIGSDFSFVFGGLFTADPEDEYQRATEAGDTRITEEGDVRIVADVLPNAAEGIFSASYTYIAFSSTAYVKFNGEWTQFTPTVNNNGTWEDPLAIYKKIDSQNWKRAY
ncbi:hypothetical protein CRP4_gp54 [Roseobacter phage CRP-4]|uniref:Uncharacterized protein n=1 Tax=Roseobacter phage CRP-4 TaxID=2559283 RepID=A0A646QW74_9CAUD|nr:hypothetical protein CRP4_gp54 [Roseobacter phage CRP-4]